MCLASGNSRRQTKKRKGTCHEEFEISPVRRDCGFAAIRSPCPRLRTTRSRLAAQLSLTGVCAGLPLGYARAMKGAEVTVKYLNDNGGLLGKQVELVNIDGKSDPVTVGNVAVELIDKGADTDRRRATSTSAGRQAVRTRSAETGGHLHLRFRSALSLRSLGDKQFTLSMWNTTLRWVLRWPRTSPSRRKAAEDRLCS